MIETHRYAAACQLTQPVRQESIRGRIRPGFINTMDPPSVSIIVATYQAGRTLENCLRSVFDQTTPDWQLIVIDGGSSDATVDLLEKHSARIAYWHSQPDQGIYDACS